MENFVLIFSDIEDPRSDNARHNLLEVLFIALAAVLCGAESCSDMAEFGLAKEDLLKRILHLRHGVPSHDTFSRVFRLLDPQAFEQAFRKFMMAFAQASGLSGVVAIDGKALRGAFARGAKANPLHMVNVWAADQRLALAQRKAPNRNEIAGTLEILKLLSLRGCIVTADALHCNRKMADAILDSGADYVLALKENQGPLYADAVALIDKAKNRDEYEAPPVTTHDRVETRRVVVVRTRELAQRHEFRGIQAIACITSTRRENGKKEQVFVRYFLLSRPFPAARVIEITRSHWTIENQLHWALDVVFDEDRARNRKDHGPENLALIRKLALNILRSDTYKASLRRKVKRAGWDDSYLSSLLGQMR